MPIVAIDQITVGPNRRPVTEQKVTELMESIRANGLLNPVTLDQNFNLIAGLHRLTACELLGLDRIECNIIICENKDRARLAEIDENVIRSELDTLERDEVWLEREQILERMGQRAQPGDNQYTHRGSETISPRVKTTSEIAIELGYSERTLQQGKQRAKNIAPKVKEAIKGTPIAKSPTALMKVARAGKQEREKAEKAEKAAQEALARNQQEEADQQSQLAAKERTKQTELQFVTLRSVTAEKESKSVNKEVQIEVQQPNVFSIQPGHHWHLERHLVYCGNTSSNEFISCLPSHAALAITTPASIWNHDYLVEEARVVAVLRSAGYIHEFCNCHRMPFKFELLVDELYVAIFSHEFIPKPDKPITVQGVEGMIAYLVSLYTNEGNYVIAPFVGHGEVLVTCERMGRICFAGDENPELVKSAITRWQNWTGKQATKIA